jgi:membrane protein required for colicin V production
MNWLDIVLAVTLLVFVILGLVQGFIRRLLGLVSVVAGLVLAALYYRGPGEVLGKLIRNPLLANFLGFLVLFVAVLVAGGLLGHLLSKAMKGPLAFVNHVLGGIFGLLEGVLIGGVLVFALLVFDLAPGALRTSRAAPLAFAATRSVVNLIPQDLRAKFNSSYEQIRKSGGSRGEKI